MNPASLRAGRGEGTRPSTYHVAGRTPGSGPVLAAFTGGPTDPAVAAHAAGLAARTHTVLIAAAAVRTTGPSVNSLLHLARNRRLRADRTAVLGRITPILHTAGVAYFATTLPVPAGTDTVRALPLDALHQLINRFGVVAVITALPLHDPTGVLRRAPHPHPSVRAAVDTPAPRAAATSVGDPLTPPAAWNGRNP